MGTADTSAAVKRAAMVAKRKKDGIFGGRRSGEERVRRVESYCDMERKLRKQRTYLYTSVSLTRQKPAGSEGGKSNISIKNVYVFYSCL